VYVTKHKYIVMNISVTPLRRKFVQLYCRYHTQMVWSHFSKGRHFTLITDQRSAKFVGPEKSRQKNTKLLVWRLELSQLTYTVCHRLGRQHVATDAHVSKTLNDALDSKYTSTLRAAWASWIFSYVPLYPVKESSPYKWRDENHWRTCAEVKPKFIKPAPGSLIKATRP